MPLATVRLPEPLMTLLTGAPYASVRLKRNSVPLSRETLAAPRVPPVEPAPMASCPALTTMEVAALVPPERTRLPAPTLVRICAPRRSPVRAMSPPMELLAARVTAPPKVAPTPVAELVSAPVLELPVPLSVRGTFTAEEKLLRSSAAPESTVTAEVLSVPLPRALTLASFRMPPATVVVPV